LLENLSKYEITYFNCKYIYYTYIYIYIIKLTKNNLFFILYNLGLILPLKFKYKRNYFPFYKIKKKFFSFLRKNEYKLHIFNSRKKFLLPQILTFNKKRFNTKIFTQNKNIFNFFKKNNVFYIDNVFKKNNVFYIDNVFKKNNVFFLKELNINNERGEVRLSRIRFKPGYQRL
jgi:hypothetical protein